MTAKTTPKPKADAKPSAKKATRKKATRKKPVPKDKSAASDDGDKPAPKATAKKSPALLIVVGRHWLHWPVPGLTMRGGKGTIVPADDPLLNTCDLPEEFRDEHHLIESDQHFKLGPAPEGSVVTPTNRLGPRRVYEALGYDQVPEGDPEEVEPAAPVGGKRTRQHTKVKAPAVFD